MKQTTIAGNTSQSLVRSSEQVTKLLSVTLTNDTTETIQTRTNIGNYSTLDIYTLFIATHLHSHQG